MEKFDLYKCEICGNIVEIIVNGNGELVCCGKPMQKLTAKNNEEAMMEKHIPIFVKKDDGRSEIRVGEVLHPMESEHHIVFIQAVSDDMSASQIKFLNINDEPKMIIDNDYSYAKEYCNIHGLWEGKNA